MQGSRSWKRARYLRVAAVVFVILAGWSLLTGLRWVVYHQGSVPEMSEQERAYQRAEKARFLRIRHHQASQLPLADRVVVRLLAQRDLAYLLVDPLPASEISALPSVVQAEMMGDDQIERPQDPEGICPTYKLSDRTNSTLASRTLRGDELRALATLWQALPIACAPHEMPGCFQPAFELAFYRGDQLLLQAAPCWDCAGVLSESPAVLLGFCSFDVDSEASKQLRSALRALLPVRASSIDQLTDDAPARDPRKRVSKAPRPTNWPVRLGTPIVQGAFDPSAVLRVADRYMSALTFCYERELESDAALQGDMQVALRLLTASDSEPDKKRTSKRRSPAPEQQWPWLGESLTVQPRLVSSTLGRPTLEQCVLSITKHWRIPGSVKSPVQVLLPLSFRPQTSGLAGQHDSGPLSGADLPRTPAESAAPSASSL